MIVIKHKFFYEHNPYEMMTYEIKNYPECTREHLKILRPQTPCSSQYAVAHYTFNYAMNPEQNPLPKKYTETLIFKTRSPFKSWAALARMKPV